MSRRHGFAVLTVGALLLAAPVTGKGAGPQADLTLDTLLARAATYVEGFIERFANLVAEERYSQTLRGGRWSSSNTATMSSTLGPRPGPSDQPQRRDVRSDLVVLRDRSVFGWVIVRDVFEVDGKVVRDREARLTRSLSTPGADVRAEGARFNLGPGVRTTNTPELAILFLRSELQPRFDFTLKASDRAHGPRIRPVEYRERARPTLVRGDDGQDLPASGRFWIDVDTGRVVETEITLRPPATSWTLTTTFTLDSTLGIAVPTVMREDYTWRDTEMTATATYSHFRRFDVSTAERMGQ